MLKATARGCAAAAVAALFAMVALAPAAGAQAQPQRSPCSPGGPTAQYPPQACGLRLGQSTARPGERISVGGDGFAPNSRVRIEFRSQPVELASVTANSAGSFDTTVVIPANASLGQHTIAAQGTNPTPPGGARELTATITIVGAAAAPGGTLPRTGAADALPLALGGAALVGIGAVAVVAARRRRSGASNAPVTA